eukprot:650561-Rhodomonas_salina.6
MHAGHRASAAVVASRRGSAPGRAAHQQPQHRRQCGDGVFGARDRGLAWRQPGRPTVFPRDSHGSWRADHRLLPTRMCMLGCGLVTFAGRCVSRDAVAGSCCGG